MHKLFSDMYCWSSTLVNSHIVHQHNAEGGTPSPRWVSENASKCTEGFQSLVI